MASLLAATPEMQSLVTLVLMALILTLFYYAILRSVPPPTKEVLTTRVVVRCVNGDAEELRSFEKGLYVGKVLGEKCPKCGSPLYVHRIFAENIFEKQGQG